MALAMPVFERAAGRRPIRHRRPRTDSRRSGRAAVAARARETVGRLCATARAGLSTASLTIDRPSVCAQPAELCRRRHRRTNRRTDERIDAARGRTARAGGGWADRPGPDRPTDTPTDRPTDRPR